MVCKSDISIDSSWVASQLKFVEEEYQRGTFQVAKPKASILDGVGNHSEDPDRGDSTIDGSADTGDAIAIHNNADSYGDAH